MPLKPTFAFMDESGTLHPNNPNRYFAVGAIIDSYPDDLIEDLHLLLQHLESKLGRTNDPKLEFRFSSVTKSSLPVYKELIELLKHHRSWRFCCLIVDTEDSKYDQPADAQQIWEEYLKFTKLLLKNNLSNQERAVLLADYYRQPSGKVHELATLPEVTPTQFFPLYKRNMIFIGPFVVDDLSARHGVPAYCFRSTKPPIGGDFYPRCRLRSKC